MAVIHLAWQRQLGYFDDCGRYLPPLNRDGTPVVNESWTFGSLTNGLEKRILQLELQAHANAEIEPEAETILSNNADLRIAILNTITALRRYFATQKIEVCKNTNPHNPHEIHIFVTASEEIDPEIDLLERFDEEWWIHQDSGFSNKVLVRLN